MRHLRACSSFCRNSSFDTGSIQRPFPASLSQLYKVYIAEYQPAQQQEKHQQRKAAARYGSAGKLIAALILTALAATVYAAAAGSARAVFFPALSLAPVRGFRPVLGLAAYAVLLLIPTFYSIREAILWHSLRSKI